MITFAVKGDAGCLRYLLRLGRYGDAMTKGPQ